MVPGEDALELISKEMLARLHQIACKRSGVVSHMIYD